MTTVKESVGFVRVEAGRMRYRLAGLGPPLFLLHSLGASSLAWKGVMPTLAQRFATYAWDMLGHGESEKPGHDLTMEEYGDSVAAAARTLNLGRVSLMGNSIGSVVALDVAARHPELVNKLVLVGCPCWPNARAREEAFTASAAAFEADGTPKALTLETLAASFANPTQEFVDFINGERRKAGVWVYKARLAVGNYEVPSRLGAVRCPTLIVYGDQDQLRSGEEMLRRGIAGASAVTLTNVGHLPQLEAPKAFVEAVLPFLTAG